MNIDKQSPMARVYYDDPFMPYIIRNRRKQYLDIPQIEKEVKKFARAQKVLEQDMKEIMDTCNRMIL